MLRISIIYCKPTKEPSATMEPTATKEPTATQEPSLKPIKEAPPEDTTSDDSDLQSLKNINPEILGKRFDTSDKDFALWVCRIFRNGGLILQSCSKYRVVYLHWV